MSDLEYSVTHWGGKRWDWALFEGAERFLRERTMENDPRAIVKLRLNDSQGGLGVATLAEGRERAMHEGTTPMSIELVIGSESWLEGLSGTLSVAADTSGDYRATMQFRSPRASDVRRCKAEFDQWLERVRLAPGRQATTASSIQAAAPGPATVEPPSSKPWWLPDVRNVRDNLVSNLIWALLVAFVGVAAYLGLRMR